jgi:hypothetical protein
LGDQARADTTHDLEVCQSTNTDFEILLAE